MKKFLIAAALAVISSTAGQAADLEAKTYTKAPAIAPVYDWSGVYVGADIGSQASRLGLSDTSSPLRPLTYDPRHESFALGGHLGYQKQWGQFVLGVEGGAASGFGSTSFDTPAIDIFAPGSNSTTRVKFKDVWTIGGRAGWAMNNWLVYATGGYAHASYGFDVRDTDPPNNTQHASPGFGGGYIGGGVEWAPWNNNWVLGGEYRHYEFSKKTDTVVAASGFVEPINFDPRTNSVMGRISYKFN
jgi:outer membrane immunogenic protein